MRRCRRSSRPPALLDTRLIKARIEQSWLQPPTARQGMSCKIKVRLIPSGDVVAANVVQSSGDPVFDRSAVTAVLKASPLPVPPSELGLFDQFREFSFDFDPNVKN